MSDKDIRDEILERATAIMFENAASIWPQADGTFNGSRINAVYTHYRDYENFKSLEEAYAWIMEGKE